MSKKVSVALLSATTLFMACGEESSSGNNNAAELDNTIIVPSEDDLPLCNSELDGRLATAGDNEYICAGKNWIQTIIADSESDLPNCTSKSDGSLAVIEQSLLA